MIGILVAAIWVNRVPEPEIDELMAEADTALAQQDFAEARRIAERILKREPEHASALIVAGKCLDAEDDPGAAVDMLSKVPSGKPPHSAEAASLAGNILFLKLGRPMDAERLLASAFRDNPDSIKASDGLAMVLGISGQWWRQIPPRLAAIRSGKITRIDLLILALAEKALLNKEMVLEMRTVSPDDPLILLAIARQEVEDERFDSAIQLLNRAIETSPNLFRAHVELGSIHFERGDKAEFAAWNRKLPPTADVHPDVWVLRGRWELAHSRSQEALRCFCEAIQRNPNHPDALYQAGRILTSMKRANEATPFLQRAKKLQQLLRATQAADTEDAIAEMKTAATLAEALGNDWEAFGWASLAARNRGSLVWAKRMTSRLKPRLSKLPLQRTDPTHNPLRTFDYRGLPLPRISKAGSDPVAKNGGSKAARAISFNDRAASAGIAFQYFNGNTNVAGGTKHMYEVMGGGVAVIDFNGDQLPDLYFTQGCNWPVDQRKTRHLDRLYLNTGRGGFIDVTESCGIRENRFSQGVAIGDIDSDGFPDILVANIGRNRLYHNNGDGTFSDVSDDAGLNRSDWSTSCAIADLSGDGHPELYFVNYLKGSDVFTRMCGPNNDGVCLPQHFPAADNRLYWSGGNGGFTDVTTSSGIHAPNGKSLGVVVGAFGRSPGLNVFVANDTVANFYFENLGSDKNGAPRFHETSLVKGLAMNGDGRSLACMGVAAGDGDGDGATDLLVTNFLGEPNTFYRQLPDGSFEDLTRSRRLRQPSVSKLGFGTQFLDADLDGRLDLIVANGHIDNYSRDGRTEYQMHPQFFVNLGQAGFREAESSTAGPYFQRKLLGRSLARLDWNRDGKEDAIVMHLDAPIALLENTTRKIGGFITLRLRGVQSSRDAIGTIVRVETQNRTVTRQLTAGDGFHASNERLLTFGLGTDKTITKMTVNWPSGRREEFHDIPADSRWILVEGAGRLLAAPTE